ncbi:ATP-binding cassette domain-containing protein [Bacteroidales bacterium OttesenSCG-928-L03]|nr:ATP-binding cassette domain-containing protein [Bacteroidales bacterium OttesenSCG-928-L03]
MNICLSQIKPTYMSEEEIHSSDIYLRPNRTFEAGKKYLIRASSGRGKTSLLNFIYGISEQYNGEITFPPLAVKDKFDLRNGELSYVFQDLKLFPEISLWENIDLKNALTRHKSAEEVRAMIDRVGLLYKVEAPVKTLSLGQRQRVAVIRALCQPFSFLLLDEPFSHLDNRNRDILVSMIEQELEKQQAGLILTSLGADNSFAYDEMLNL